MRRAAEDTPIEEEFPGWSEVWHRSDGAKGIVVGWLTLADGVDKVMVDWGADRSESLEHPKVLATADPELCPNIQ